MKRDFNSTRFPVSGHNNSALRALDSTNSIRRMMDAQLKAFSVFDISGINAAMKAFSQPPYLAMMQDINKTMSQVVAPISHIQKAFLTSPLFEEIVQIQRVYSSAEFQRNLSAMQNEIIKSPLVNTALAVQKALQTPEVLNVAKLLNKNLYSLNQVAVSIVGTVISQSPEKFNESSLEETFQILDVDDDISLEKLNERLDSFETRIITSIERNSRPFGLESIITIILTIFITVLTSLSDRKFQTQNHEEHAQIESEIEAIEQSQEKILDMVIEMYSEVQDSLPLYVVERQTSVSLRPKGKSPRVAPLYPNQKVELEDAKGKWVYISYFNYLDEKTYSGWVLKKYLKRITQ